MKTQVQDVAVLIDEFVDRAGGRRSPGYSFKAQAIEAAAALLAFINSRQAPELEDALHVADSLSGASRAYQLERLLEGLKGIENTHGVKARLGVGRAGYSLEFGL